MNRIISILTLALIVSTASAQSTVRKELGNGATGLVRELKLDQQSAVKDKELEDEAAGIAKALKLDKKAEHLVYNVLNHVKTRASDIPFGHAKYEKLLSYVEQEQAEMMKVILSPSKYKEYDKLYKQQNKDKLQEYLVQNSDYISQHGVLPEKVETAGALMAMPENPVKEDDPSEPSEK